MYMALADCRQLTNYLLFSIVAALLANDQFKIARRCEGRTRHYNHHLTTVLAWGQQNGGTGTTIRSTAVKCAEGKFSSALEGACLPCSLCGQGLYVAHRCLPHRDTVCDSCHTYMGPHNTDFIQKCHHQNNLTTTTTPSNQLLLNSTEICSSDRFLSSFLIILVVLPTLAITLAAVVIRVKWKTKIQIREGGYTALALTMDEP